MKDWTKYKAEDVKNGLDENGNRLFSLFVQDHIKVFGIDVCPNCNDFPIKFQNFINKIKEMENKKPCEFQLKKMYEGIPTSFGSSKYVTNQNISDELAIELLQNHPRGNELFESLPKNVDELVSGNGNNSANNSNPATVKIFDKDLSVEEVKELFEKAEIKSNATSVNGLQKAFDKLSEEKKEKIKELLA